MTMRAAVLHGREDLRYETVSKPGPGPGQVLIAVKACGVCGSDVPRVNLGSARFFPIVLGHEFSGVVAALGEGVEGIAVGDRCSAAPLVPCLACDDCLKGDYALCRRYKFIGSSLLGAMADFVVVPAKNVVIFDSGVPFETAALLEPACVALHGLWRSRWRPGRDAAVLGGGTIGLFALKWLGILGAARTAVFDVNPSRLELARELGADAVFDSSGEGFVEAALDWTGGRGFGHVLETAGRAETVALALRLAANRADVGLIGTSPADLAFDWRTFELLNRKELVLSGSWMSHGAPFPGPEWTMAAARLGDGRLTAEPSMIHRVLPMERAAEAFRMFRTPGAVQGKLMLVNP